MRTVLGIGDNHILESKIGQGSNTKVYDFLVVFSYVDFF